MASKNYPLIAAAILISLLVFVPVISAQVASQSTDQEDALIAVLKSDAPASEKAVTCKLLAIHGSDAAVPELAKLLTDPQLNSWARIALEAIPGSTADAALRDAVDSLDGRLLVGTINSIGVRRDAGALEILIDHLRHDDPAVASSSAVALGHIGDDAAANALRAELDIEEEEVRSAVAQGCVLCAERLLAAGRPEEAADIYDEVRDSDVPQQRIIEATRGAILARGSEGVPMLMELFRSPDKKMFQLALSTAREIPGSGVDRAMAGELTEAAPERAALIIQAMTDRPDTVDRAAILVAAGEGHEKVVRLAAIRALQRIGDASCLSELAEIALDEDGDLADAARETLAVVQGARVDTNILTSLDAFTHLEPRDARETNRLALYIEITGERRIEATDLLLESLNNEDANVRRAVLTALGKTVTIENLDVLTSQVIALVDPADVQVAQQALQAAAVRMPDREACAGRLAAAFDEAPSGQKSVFLEILAEVGGDIALDTIAGAAKNDDPGLQDVGSRLIGKWNSLDAAPLLLDLAQTAPQEKYRIRALRGYIGIIRKFSIPDDERAEMLRQAFNVATRNAERKLVLDVLELYPCDETFQLAFSATRVPEVNVEATRAVLSIAQALGDTGLDIEELLSEIGLEEVDLQIIKAEYGAGSAMIDVTAVLRKQAGDLPLIKLPAGNYNQSFGSDPAPGTPKQLKIRYRFNGTEGEAVFDENAVIVLPDPR